MKNLVVLSVFLFLLTAGKNPQTVPPVTVLGMGTPYGFYPEILNGKVKSLTEKNYWALRQGKSYTKAKPLSKADRVRLGGWTEDFTAEYDQNGNFVACTIFNEQGKPLTQNKSVIENNRIVRLNFFRNDSLLSYDLITYGSDGFRSEATRMSAGMDTLMRKFVFKNNKDGHTTDFQIVHPNGVTEKYIYGYNDQNRFRDFSVMEQGMPRVLHEVKYNDKDKISELVMRDKNNKISARNDMTYQYDAKGNWVKAYVKAKDYVVIEERSYTYFE